jgi:hypothetical protein
LKNPRNKDDNLKDADIPIMETASAIEKSPLGNVEVSTLTRSSGAEKSASLHL